MTSRADLLRLGELAALRTATDRSALAAVERRAAPIRAALRQLEAPPPDDSSSLAVARDRALWQDWAACERRRLNMELARLRVELETTRRAAGRSAAREAVIETLAAKPKRRR